MRLCGFTFMKMREVRRYLSTTFPRICSDNSVMIGSRQSGASWISSWSERWKRRPANRANPGNNVSVGNLDPGSARAIFWQGSLSDGLIPRPVVFFLPLLHQFVNVAHRSASLARVDGE